MAATGTISAGDMEFVWNPYPHYGADPHEATAQMARRERIIRHLRADGYRLQLEMLYTPPPAEMVAGMRVGLFDGAGCVEERFYTKEGRGDIRHAIKTLVTTDGKAPAFWATEAL